MENAFEVLTIFQKVNSAQASVEAKVSQTSKRQEASVICNGGGMMRANTVGKGAPGPGKSAAILQTSASNVQNTVEGGGWCIP